jgi:hypothetical protein
MRYLFVAALALPLAFGLGAPVSANDAHHPAKQAKTKSAPKKAVKKPPRQTPPKKNPS